MKNKAINIVAITTACLPAVIYLVWIDAYYWLLEGGRFKAFIQPRLWPIFVLALILLLIFVAAFISKFSWKANTPVRIDSWLRAAILFMPVLFLWSTYGQSLGAYAFSKRSLRNDEMVNVPAGRSGQPSSANLSEDRVSLLDLLRNTEGYNGKHVTVEGIVYREAGMADDTFLLFRFAVICCAADALPLSVIVSSAAAGDLSNDTWVKVQGQVTIDTINVRQRPAIIADIVQPIPMPSPEKRYLFF